jgi:glycine cleavage system H lipoate-binding protein
VEKYIELEDCWIYEGHDEFFIAVSPLTKEKLGKVSFVDTIPMGKVIHKGSVIGIVECENCGEWPMKSPVDAIVTSFNDRLIRKPDLFGAAPEDGWIVRCKIKGVASISDLGEVKNR